MCIPSIPLYLFEAFSAWLPITLILICPLKPFLDIAFAHAKPRASCSRNGLNIPVLLLPLHLFAPTPNALPLLVEAAAGRHLVLKDSLVRKAVRMVGVGSGEWCHAIASTRKSECKRPVPHKRAPEHSLREAFPRKRLEERDCCCVPSYVVRTSFVNNCKAL